MSEQILAVLKSRLGDPAATGEIDAGTRRNRLKEELQFYVLNFIYHHPEYNGWIMYGGSALRIIHGLDRMSVDLDFEISHTITEEFLEELKKEIEEHFANTYGTAPDFFRVKINNGRGLTAKFCVGRSMTGHASEWVDVKIDLHHFIAPKTVVLEHRPTNEGQFSFVIVTYNMSALMASKIAAIFLRERRGVDKNIYDYKGRDIYDLLWYMEKKIIPDFDYLNIKLKERGEEVPDMKALFNTLTVAILNYEKMDNLLKDDVSHLFENPFQFENWLKNWRESYLRLLDDYKIRTVTKLEGGVVEQDFNSSRFSFVYWYDTEEGESVRVVYTISGYWIIFPEGELPIKIDKNLEEKIEFSNVRRGSRQDTGDKLKQYATLFYKKTEKYFKKTNRIMLGDSIATKVIRMTAENLNQKEEIVLNKSALLSCELDDLLK